MITTERQEPNEGFICIDEQLWYQIPEYQRMAPFFMTIISPDTLWMYISSTGGLTCGRKNADHALFPYYPDDRVTENYTNTGSVTAISVEQNERERVLWRPFREFFCDEQRVRRSIAKHSMGNSLRFTETESSLDLEFSYEWSPSPRWGWVRTCRLTNMSESPVSLSICDGVRNILPANIDRNLQLRLSTLTDAYKLNELVDGTLALYSITSRISDKAEANESLMATSVWQVGMKDPKIFLSEESLYRFERNESPAGDTQVTGSRGAYLVNSTSTLYPGQRMQWSIVLEVDQDHCKIAQLLKELSVDTQQLEKALQASLHDATEKLRYYSGLSDGVQLLADQMRSVQHHTSTMYNIMRGGLLAEGYSIDKRDLESYLDTFDPEAMKKRRAFLDSLPEKFSLEVLRRSAAILTDGDPLDLRVAHALCSYLPVSFSRRHGDPSRPWNEFSIDLWESDGSPKRTYEGNWRDLFQNWEALALSFPFYLPTMITIFLQGITIDGYNPYKIGRSGYWWECPDEHDPWANIGYWNDHQGIYLFKLLELCQNMIPDDLQQLASRSCLYTVEVPYRIKDFDQILSDPHNTIVFDETLHTQLIERREKFGTVGTFLTADSGELVTSTLIEKLLTIFLVKATNFVPQAGIWLNTQRPEWNDANNALVGWGCSIVTLCYLYRGLGVFEKILLSQQQVELHEYTIELLKSTMTIFREYQPCCVTGFDDDSRYLFVRDAGYAGQKYRRRVYAKRGLDQMRFVDVEMVRDFLCLFRTYLGASIGSSKRTDGLYHGYTVLQYGTKSLSIRQLPLMLEGQVAVLSSGLLEKSEVCSLLDALRKSSLYERRQGSYLLYPASRVKGFLQINSIGEHELSSSRLLSRLLLQGDTRLVCRDTDGGVHFSSHLSTRDDVVRILNELKEESEFASSVEKEFDRIQEIYEKTFEHATYTGRSGRMFAYEGNGSIYWHMVSKLLVAVQEQLNRIDPADSSYAKLKAAYEDIYKGLGASKQAKEYGAFPFDAYSHSPLGKGARQPGLTGHVKEELLVRQGELGIRYQHRRLRFDPHLLDTAEFLLEENSCTLYTADGSPIVVNGSPGSLVFTVCGTPVTYMLGREDGYRIEIDYQDGSTREIDGKELSEEDTHHILARDGKIKHLVLYLPQEGEN